MTARTVSTSTVLSLPELTQLNKFTDWDLDFRQIESGPMETRIAVRSGKMVALLEIQMSRSLHQVGIAPPGTMPFGIPQNRHLSEWRGDGIAIPSLLSFGYWDGFQGGTSEGSHLQYQHSSWKTSQIALALQSIDRCSARWRFQSAAPLASCCRFPAGLAASCPLPMLPGSKRRGKHHRGTAHCRNGL